MTKASTRTVILTVSFKRNPGHLYFIDKDGDLASRKRNPGHIPSGPLGINHPNLKVLKLGIKKQRGYLYFLDKYGQIISQPMHQFRNQKRSQ